MRYGYFDDTNYEYVFERPDTPRSWTNYFGTRDYGAIITNQEPSARPSCAESSLKRTAVCR